MSEGSAPMYSKLRWSDVARLGGTGIRSRPTRAVLSALGIAIGIAAMVGVIGVSTSSQAQLAEQLRALGTNMLTAQAGEDLSGSSTRLPDDAVGRMRLIDGVEKATSTATLSGVSVYRSRLADKNATGGILTMAAEQSLLDVVAGSVARGTWLNEATATYPATVLGAKAAQRLGVVEPGTDVGEDLGAQAQAGVVDLGVEGGDEPAAGDLLGHGSHPREHRGARGGAAEIVVGAHGEDPAVDHHEHVVESGHREVHHPLGQVEVVAVAAHGQPGGEPPEGHGRGHRPLRLIPPGHQSSSQVTSSGKRSSTVEKKARVMPRPMSMKASSWAWLIPAPT